VRPARPPLPRGAPGRGVPPGPRRAGAGGGRADILPRESVTGFACDLQLEIHLTGCLGWYYALRRHFRPGAAGPVHHGSTVLAAVRPGADGTPHAPPAAAEHEPRLVSSARTSLRAAPRDHPREVLAMTDPDDALLRPRLLVLRIIAGALLAGVTMFLAIVLYLVLVQNQGQPLNPPPPVPILSLMAVGMLVITAPLSFVVPGFLTRSAVRRIAAGTWRPAPGAPPPASDAQGLISVFQSVLIVGLALLEGTAFFGCIAYLWEGNALALGVVAVALLLMLWRFPTESGVRAWLAAQAEQVAQVRRTGPAA
jgi:hypothetical protein